jgi:spore coat polysaccharide biosynthesis predicted glycosyltransferase SpsG
MGTPSIIIPFDKKQFLLNKESSETGAFITIKSDKISSNLGKELYSMIEDREIRNNMSKKASILLDGKGINRIINHLGF